MPAKRQKKAKRLRLGRLESASDVAKYVARCIRDAHREEGGNETKFYRRVLMASMLLKAVETASLERRINTLEKRLNENT